MIVSVTDRQVELEQGKKDLTRGLKSYLIDLTRTRNYPD